MKQNTARKGTQSAKRYYNPATDAPRWARYETPTGRKQAEPALQNIFPPRTEMHNAAREMLLGVGPAHLTTAQAALKFMLGGNATFTLRSKATGVRYTYNVAASKPNERFSNTVHFVKLLTGPENTNDYSYLGMIRNGQFSLTAKSKMTNDSAPVKAIAWTMRKLNNLEALPADLEIWHAGRCGRCNRVLTVPESIASGFGPECITKI